MANTGQKISKINMGSIMRRVGYVTGQSRKITYYRPPIYEKDSYGVETGVINTNEILVPNVQAYMRNQVEKNYVIERGGHNIIGNSRVYLPSLQVMKNFPNFDQSNNILFNEVEGFDKIVDVDRVVYDVVTSSSTNWSLTSGSVSSDGDELSTFVINTSAGNVEPTYNVSSNPQNVLEADRVTFQIKASGAVTLKNMKTFTSGSTDVFAFLYNNADVTIPTEEWLTVDYPFVSGTTTHPASSSSIYLSGTRYNVPITNATSGSYNNPLHKLTFNVSSSASGNRIYLRSINYYKSIEWSIHQINDYDDDFMVMDCVRTSGKRESIRRAYN